MSFLIFNLDDGSKKRCNLAELSKSLAPNCEILREVGDSYEAIGLVSHKILVLFAVEWADYALQNYSKKNIIETQACISLVKKWIEDSSSVSNKELVDAADAFDAVDAADAAANAAANAADAAAYAAAYTADAAAYAAAYTADAAANAAAYTADADTRNKEFERQGNFILKYFLDSSSIY